jgi:hypothetical protein
LSEPLGVGTFTLTLDVNDGSTTASDEMVLTINNTPPDAQVTPESQTVQIHLDLIVIGASLTDFDGDTVSYEWVKGGEVLASGEVTAPVGGDPIAIDDLIIFPCDSRFSLGTNTVDLVVSDGFNAAVSIPATVEVTDTLAPTLCPIASRLILWPPNHQLVPVAIWANAFDNGGGAITLDVTVESSQPEDPGETDYYIDSINNDTGIIWLRLRAEREGPGFGRIYTVTVTATDESGNQSSAIVRVLCPRRGWRMWRWRRCWW